MGNSVDRQLSLRKKAANLGERLDTLEAQVEDIQRTIPQLAMATNQALNQMNTSLNEVKEYLDVVIGLVGLEAVQAQLEENRMNRMKAAAEQTKANIAKALEEGTLAKAEKISDKSLIVGKEIKADGSEIPPGYAAVRFSQVKDDFKTKLLDQAVGFTMETDGGGKFEVLEVYEDVIKETKTEAAATEPIPATDDTSAAPAEAPAPTQGEAQG